MNITKAEVDKKMLGNSQEDAGLRFCLGLLTAFVTFDAMIRIQMDLSGQPGGKRSYHNKFNSGNQNRVLRFPSQKAGRSAVLVFLTT